MIGLPEDHVWSWDTDEVYCIEPGCKAIQEYNRSTKCPYTQEQIDKGHPPISLHTHLVGDC